MGGAAQTTGTGGDTGLTVTQTDNSEEEHGMTGYEETIISDGKTDPGGEDALWVRIDPENSSTVEFAFDYSLFGFTTDDLMNLLYLEFEAIKGGAKDPANYFWDDKYTFADAGSPYVEGLGNIYELDTLRGVIPSSVPEPATMMLMGAGFAALLASRRKRK